MRINSPLQLVPAAQRPRPYALAKWQPSGMPGIGYREGIFTDDYLGERDALVRYGIVPDGCFPGDPGMRKTRVRIFADGTIPTAPPTANLPKNLTHAPGAKLVILAPGGRFEVRVQCDPTVEHARTVERLRMLEEWENRQRLLDACIPDQAGRARRAQLHLVWSRPA